MKKVPPFEGFSEFRYYAVAWIYLIATIIYTYFYFIARDAVPNHPFVMGVIFFGTAVSLFYIFTKHR